ncbi:MAG: rane-bound protease, partial [Xanthobacteraceae bacterium]|nr:rane-bound protease [Xanthobacteraceae bacterium]
MIELLLLLVGGRVVRKRWRTLAALGVLWIALGIFFLVDAMIDDFRIPPVYFTVPLLIDAVVSVVAGLGGSGTYRALRFAKAGVLVAVSALVVIHPWGSDIVIGLLVGTLLVVDSCWRAASAYVVRFAKWRRSLAAAGVEFLIGVWSLLPWPTYWQGEVGIDVGTLMIVTGVSLIGLALRLRRLPPDMPIARIFSDGWPSDTHDHDVPHAVKGPATGDITIHVWTPTGGLAPLRRGVARYVAALDENGVISTGHAALEASDVYISHYPAVEIDRDQSQFAQTLRATADNNVPGKFQPNYEFESGEWCPSTRQIVLAGL